jgi:hypothetical protein
LAEFQAWQKGDGSETNPGLPPDVAEWLDSSVGISEKLAAWAEEGK